MAKFKVERQYYDGCDVYCDDIGFVRGEELEAFVEHLLHCGYEGEMGKKHGRFSATIEPDWLDHHGNHCETIRITKIKKLKSLSPANWGEEIKTFAERDYARKESGNYIWVYPDEEDSGEESDESDSDDGCVQVDIDLSFWSNG